MKKKVLLAMSGGIDSSMAAVMLINEGYEVAGITMKLWNFIEDGGLINDREIEKTKFLAEKYNIPLKIVDVRKDFEREVVNYFVEEYITGYTPNPCVMCNPKIKWGMLWKAFDENFDYYATGHYAIIGNEKGRFFVKQAKDKFKDQSYFLWRLSQKQLSKTLFPLGSITKTEIKKKAEKEGFVSLSKQKESQEICFLAGKDYREFLLKKIPNIYDNIGKGDFIWVQTGEKVGEHNGFFNFTIGQRRGLNIALGKPVYVVSIDAKQNIVYLGEEKDLYSKEMIVGKINFQKYEMISDGMEVFTKIRYRSKGYTSKLFMLGEDKIKVIFDVPVRAITPGQSAVFYEHDDVVGGGIIE